jgi:hypothetical protein
VWSAGKIRYGGWVDSQLLHRMCAVWSIRGPDSRGVFVEVASISAFGGWRSSPSAGGDQPLFNEDP